MPDIAPLPPTDAAGFLLDCALWNQNIARTLAAQDGITLGAAHFEIILILRAYYQEYQLTPPLRILANVIARQLGEEKGQRRYLYALFPNGPVRDGARYAGLPKPPSCI